MAVLVMETISAEPHTNADKLRVYKFKYGADRIVQIVANNENIYNIGDLVNVALDGSVLKGGLTIGSTKIRGINSEGMALGKSLSGNVGDDVSSEFCIEEPAGNRINHIAWPSIESFFNIWKHVKAEATFPKIFYRGKIKLHGTNASVQIVPGRGIYAQSRSNLINVERDNAGFAAWVKENENVFAGLLNDLELPSDRIVVFGEWCGKGIQKGVAISNIERKIFAPFSIRIQNKFGTSYVNDPELIKGFLPDHPDIFILPWATEKYLFDFGNELQIKLDIVEQLNSLVKQIDSSDPWVKEVFNVEGPGEGLVMYPYADLMAVPRVEMENLIFKAKGESHRAVKSKDAVQFDPEKVNNITEFVKLFLTDSRLEQGIKEACGDVCEMKNLGSFLKWVAQDVQKESYAELEKSGLVWKDITKDLGTQARIWFLKKANNLL